MLEGKKVMLTPKSNIRGTKFVALTIVCSALVGAGFLVSAAMPLVPGTLMLRLGSFLTPLFGILFGPVVGSIAAYTGALLSQLLGGLWTAASPISTIGEVLAVIIPAYLVTRPKNIWQVALWSGVGGLAMTAFCSAVLDLFGVFPFVPAFTIIGLCDVIPIVIGTPICVLLLFDRVKAMGYYWRK